MRLRPVQGTDYGKLNGKQREQFQNALVQALSLPQLEQMLLHRLDKQLDLLSAGGTKDYQIFQVLERAEAESWTAELLQAALGFRVNDVALLKFAEQFGMVPAVPQGPELERTIQEANGMVDVGVWWQRLGEIMNRVCRVEIPTGAGTLFGTGFLLGPDLLMTNYHVLERVIKEELPAASVGFRFDYRWLGEGRTLNQGKVFTLAKTDWLLDASPYSQLDTDPAYETADRSPDELDYALVRLSDAPGDGPVSAEAGGFGTALRGWLTPSATRPAFAENSSLFILQHPDAKPLKLAMDSRSVIGVNANRTRVRYETNTESGSSGSPCFTADWELIALHHAGDPNYSFGYKPRYNQGIPFSTILELLKARGKSALLEN